MQYFDDAPESRLFYNKWLYINIVIYKYFFLCEHSLIKVKRKVTKTHF